jgi:excisionase family DNA binding protein
MPLTESADYLGVSAATLSRMVKRGAISFVISPFDRRVRLFRREDLDALMGS